MLFLKKKTGMNHFKSNTKQYKVISKQMIRNIHIRTVQLDIIKVLFIRQLMHQWVVLKKNCIRIYIKTDDLMIRINDLLFCLLISVIFK